MMVLYSGTTCPFSQRCRFVLFEKGMDFEIRDIDLFNKPEEISATVRFPFWSKENSSSMNPTLSMNTLMNGFRIPS